MPVHMATAKCTFHAINIETGGTGEICLKSFVNGCSLNRNAYKLQRNVCTKLLRKQKRDYFNDLDTKLISDNKMFWNVVKPLFP